MLYFENAPMQCRCGDCNQLMTIDFPSGLELRRHMALMRATSCLLCGSENILIGQSRSWAEDREIMSASHMLSVERRAADWIANGEIGNSARTIHAFMTTGRRGDAHHPHDASDLRRCLLLLRRIPEWVPRMHEMSALSPEWSRIAAIWDDLSLSFTRETGPNWQRVSARRTSEMLKAAIDGKPRDD